MRKGEETRNTILAAAMAEASTVGLTAITIGGLARQVELSKSGLFAHFSSKEDLQLQILQTARERFVNEVMAPALRESRGESRVRALFENWLGWSKAEYLPGGCLFISTANELDDQPGALRDYLVQSQKDWLGALATAAKIAGEEGHFRSDLDTDQFAYDFYSIILAYHHIDRLLQGPDTESRCREAFERLLERVRVDNN